MERESRYTLDWTDAGGETHPPAGARKYQRIVSLVPSLTETLCALGGRDRLVGITAFCIRPDDLLSDPRIVKVGGTKKFSREKLFALKPDLVLLNMEENELDDIAFLRTRVACYLNGVKTVTDGIESIRELGALLGLQERAASLARDAEQLLEKIRSRVQARRAAGGRTLRVFYPIWRDPWMCAGPDTFIADHLRTLGAEEVPRLADQTRYPRTSLSGAAACAPDVAWLPSEPYEFKAQDAAEVRATPGLEHVPVKLVNGDHVCWFGVRQTEGLAYSYEMLWGQSVDVGPLPLLAPRTKA